MSEFDKSQIVNCHDWVRASPKLQLLWDVPGQYLQYQKWSKEGTVVKSKSLLSNLQHVHDIQRIEIMVLSNLGSVQQVTKQVWANKPTTTKIKKANKRQITVKANMHVNCVKQLDYDLVR